MDAPPRVPAPPMLARAALDPHAITRPDPVLRTYYTIVSLLSGPGLVITLPMLMFKYATLRYRFDDEGIAMSWGVLFRREIYLTYRRIQDIHVTRGLLQRWLNIATISVQTASGSMGAEMQIEGIVQYEALRDFLYARMRGAHGEADSGVRARAVPEGSRTVQTTGATQGHDAPGDASDEALVLLRQIAEELRMLRAARSGGAGERHA